MQHEAPRCAAHPEALAAFLALRVAAANAGFQLHPVSSFRDFATQCRIWNHKFAGERPLFDADGNELSRASMTEDETLSRILDWTALPGASRHHWGTEFDVVDLAGVAPDYRVQLLPQETRPGGVFHRLHRWLDDNIDRFGFFRPYARYQGGVQPEPWHLSYAPLAIPALAALTLEVLGEALVAAPIAGKPWVLAHLGELFDSHVHNIVLPPPRHGGFRHRMDCHVVPGTN